MKLTKKQWTCLLELALAVSRLDHPRAKKASKILLKKKLREKKLREMGVFHAFALGHTLLHDRINGTLEWGSASDIFPEVDFCDWREICELLYDKENEK